MFETLLISRITSSSTEMITRHEIVPLYGMLMETVLQRRQTLLFAKMTHNRRQDCVDYAKDYEYKG